TDTTMMSPTPAKRRLEPPSTLMHWTRLAPLLSATSRLDCIWIIDPFLSLQPEPVRRSAKNAGLRRGRYSSDVGFHRLGRSRMGVPPIAPLPGLELGDRRGLFDPPDLPLVILVGLIVGVFLLRPLDDLAVQGVLHPPLDQDHD